ncbi:acetyltransferase [Aureococcus anophagefferens]|nr:acetyltransferase [Aureococcus anophagefferens]
MVIMDRRPSGKAAVLSFPETERLSSANLMAVPMYLQHGFTSICTASALAETGALRYMMEHERWSLRSLCEGLKLQPGYTKSCVHLLVSLDLLVDEGGGGYRRGRDFDDFVRLPFESIEKYLSYDFAKVFDQNVNAFFAQIDLTGPKLPRVQLLLESFYLAPIVIYLRMYVQGTSEAFKTTHLRLDESSLGPSVLAIFQGLGWCADNTSKLTYMGTYVLSTALNAGVPISYYPMFQELPKILMGDGSIFAAQEADGHEVHVDRVLNVIASGAQHKRFFEHMCNGVFNRVFDDQPLEDQPAAVADMGCGDGRLLLTLYEYVRDHTKRGKHLDEFPVHGHRHRLQLRVARRDQGDPRVPEHPLRGPVGRHRRPRRGHGRAREAGFPRDSVLHVRTFIDHDRPYIAPKRPGDDYAMYAHGVYNKNDGTIIDPSTMLQSLVEHLERWSDAVGVHGMCILEAGQLPARLAGQHMEQCVSLAFDNCQSLSHQYLVPLPQWLLCAAGAGLFPDVTSLRVPGQREPHHAEPLQAAGYKVRHARPSDLTRCLELEAKSWDPDMRTAASTVERRFEALPTCNFVMTRDDVVVGVVFFQFLDDVEELLATKWVDKDALGKDEGRYLQLLDIFVDSQTSSTMGGSIGQELRDFVMCYARVLRNVGEICGVTRARNFRKRGEGQTYEGYCMKNNGVHDSGLALHTRAGARLHQVVEGWRPEDVDNDGNGVYMSYVVGPPSRSGVAPIPHGPPSAQLSSPSRRASILTFPSSKLSGAKLMAVPMYLQHGFTTPGYAQSGVHTLLSLDLLVEQGPGAYRLGRDFADFAKLPFDAIAEYLAYDFAKVFDADDNSFFAKIDLGGPKQPRIQVLLESFYLAPIVIYLRMYVQGTSEAFKTTHLDLKESSLGPSVTTIFQGLDWMAKTSNKLTYKGTYVLATALNAGVPISYYPMFQELPKILKGDGSIFAAQEADGHEVHVDRVLNVIASGAQHKRFFEHMCNGVFVRVFDDLPLEDQPAAVADMGCGDGRLLLTLYEYVRDHTKRGKHLDKFPFTVIGIDFNYESLDVTKETLGSRNIPFEVQWGDIGDPDAAMDELEKRGFPRDSVLHVRTFIDHDRPYIAPKRPGDDYAMYAHGVYNKNDGTIIDPSTMLQSLVEHLERWSDAVGVHGMCILEAGQLPARLAGQHMEQCVSLAFDNCQSLSHQYLVPLPQWLLCAAGAGLFPDVTSLRAFPDNVSRIMLSHFKPRGYKVRHARPSDLTRCLELEAKSWDPDMRTAPSVIERRIADRPTCNFVMTRDGAVVGVVFFQFLDDVSSTMGGSIGQELRDFVMCYARVLRNVTEICGVTRARNFRAFADKGETYEKYCLRNNGVHDSGLALHSRAGATLHKVVHNWRPEDGDNDGNGVYIPPAAPSPPASPSKKKKKEKVAKKSKWPAYVPPPCVRPEPKPLPNNPLRIWKAKMDAGLIPPPEKRLGGRQKVPQRVVHPEPYMFDEMAKCDLLAIPMYLQHGFCLLSICSAMADLDVNITLWMHKFQAFNVRELSEKLELRPGYCTSLVNSLVTLGFIRERSMWGDEVQYEVDMEVFNDLIRLPYEPIADYLKFDFASIFRDDVDVFPTMDLQGPKIPKMQLLLEGFYLAPIVIYLRMHLHPSSAVFAATHLNLKSVPVMAPTLIQIFRRLDWLDKGTMKLTYKGTYVLAAALNAGVPISYYPMFQELPKILKGDGSIFAAQEADGHEVHVDRVLNVVASGAQHRRFFEHMCNGLLSRVFNDEPLEQQPRAVADMGCGDGRLLLTLYEYVRDQTKRGKHLDKHPLTLIGVDFNDESLEWGDIGDPAFVVEALEKKGYARDSVLHVRSFLDHDRPYVAPKRDADAFRMYTRGVYVRNDGDVIAPKTMLQSPPGQLPPLVAGYEMERCVSLAFDCCQTLSHQYLVPLPQWLVCAAAAGLFPDAHSLRTFPESVSRIMLSHFKPRGYKIRHATLDDLDAVVALEAGCRGLELRTPRSVLEKRLKERARFNFALHEGGALLGVLFFQFVDDIPTLLESQWKDRDKLAVPESAATHAMILDVFADDAADSSLRGAVAAELLNFLLCYARALSANVNEICGVVRAARFKTAPKIGDGSFEDYVFTDNGAHDPALALHAAAGAKVQAVVDNWWPEDGDNGGRGAYATYVVGAPPSNRSKLP